MDSILTPKSDDTLPDSAWKDSFDRLLDDRSVLRNKKIIKRDIRASLNLNSSCENSFPGNSLNAKLKCDLPAKTNYLDVPNDGLCPALSKRVENIETISTPLRVRETINPFKCTLSPIEIWEFEHFKKNKNPPAAIDKQYATPVANKKGQCTNENISLLENEFVQKSPTSLLVENIKTRRSRKQVCFDTKIVIEDNSSPKVTHLRRSKCAHPLQPGKWRKSLNLWRRTQSTAIAENVQWTIPASVSCRTGSGNGINAEKRKSSNTLAACHRKSVLNRKCLSLTKNVKEDNFEQELLRRCCQQSPVLFNVAYNKDFLQHCCKIGEGAFGEVFLYKNPKAKKEENIVLKIIPIEGKNHVNGEAQKTFEQILQEVVICMELCALNDKNREDNFAPGFVNIKKVRCVNGQYPEKLLQLWEEYDEEKESENDHPNCFDSGQMFVVMEMAFSGEDLESFLFKNAEQSFYALLQIIYTLAIGENVYQFEHRDLHWGNVLVLKTKHKYISYKLAGKMLTLPTKGVQITIIDYTLSRITYDKVCYYNDLACDPELFTATGDYQFDIYRKMRGILKDNWKKFNPKTNIFWISYIISKMLDGVSYGNSQQKLHLQYLTKLKDLSSTILTYKSCNDCALDMSSKLK